MEPINVGMKLVDAAAPITVGDMMLRMFPDAEIHLTSKNGPEEYTVIVNDVIVMTVWKAWWDLPFNEYRDVEKAHALDKYFKR